MKIIEFRSVVPLFTFCGIQARCVNESFDISKIGERALLLTPVDEQFTFDYPGLSGLHGWFILYSGKILILWTGKKNTPWKWVHFLDSDKNAR